jgi:hypothetical protein
MAVSPSVRIRLFRFRGARRSRDHYGDPLLDLIVMEWIIQILGFQGVGVVKKHPAEAVIGRATGDH